MARLNVESGPVRSNRTRASLSKFLNWCIAEQIVDFNVALGTNKNDETSRNRVLNADELRKVWRALPDNDYGEVVKLLALTGQRLREIGELRWAEVDLDKAIIALPPSRTKNNRAHVIPLSKPAGVILEAKQRDRRRFASTAARRL